MTKMTSDFVELKNLTAVEIASTITSCISKYGVANVTVETQLKDDTIRLYLECRRPLNDMEKRALRQYK